MKKSSITLSVLLVVLLVVTFSGCKIDESVTEETVIPLREPLHVDASYDGKEIEITADRLLIVTLESNATTGFQWELAELTNEPVDESWPGAEQEEPEAEQEESKQGVPQPTIPVVPAGPHEIIVLEHVEHKYIPPESEGVEGAGGKEEWTFRPLNIGKSTIYLEYSRPWEGGEKAAKTFVLSVVVK